MSTPGACGASDGGSTGRSPTGEPSVVEESSVEESPTTVDARGARCPMPVIMVARAAASLPGGSLVTLIATDPAARHDVPAWARIRGHVVVDDSPAPSRPDEVRITVRLSEHG
ncbi:sulfurtransferase TusA [mine drainage metagenome]|uniref:Sulfurtransferase TusA n=1 Tax=mine drainage metagenome TaxID=410659 RepID=A0A1J5RL73_9ZZZZ